MDETIICPDCQRSYPVDTMMRINGHPVSTRRHCPYCHVERRMKNRQSYPLCPMCNTPTYHHQFLRNYQGYRLDLIKVCCQNCIPRFEAMVETEQHEILHRAMVKAYGATAVIYALHYGEGPEVHHIGRTKQLTTRMRQHKNNPHRGHKIHHHSVLEHVSFGALSIEREARWFFHALKYGWPIDNFEMFTESSPLVSPEERAEQRAREVAQKDAILKGIADIEPLTASYEEIYPLLRRMWNATDARIAHWFVEHSTTRRAI